MENSQLPNDDNVQKNTNQITKAVHKKDFLVQILIPFLIILAGIVLIVISLINNQIGSFSNWADIIVILTSLPILLIGFVLTIIFIGLIYLINLLNKKIPPFTYKTQMAIIKIKSQVEHGADISAMPVIQINTFLSSINAIFDLFKGKDE